MVSSVLTLPPTEFILGFWEWNPVQHHTERYSEINEPNIVGSIGHNTAGFRTAIQGIAHGDGRFETGSQTGR